MNDDEILKKEKQINDLLSVLKVDEKTRWYLAGLFDGINVVRGIE